MSPAEIRSALALGPVRVVGRGSHDLWAYPGLCESVVTVEGGLLAYSPDDQFITVGAGMLVTELRAILAERGQMIPLLEPYHRALPPGHEGVPRRAGGRAVEILGSDSTSLPLASLGYSPLEKGGEHDSSPSAEGGEFGDASPSPGSQEKVASVSETDEVDPHNAPSDPLTPALSPLGGEGARGTFGGLLSMAFPHPGEATYFDWRTWVLGMTIMLPDGRIVKSGSTVVKSVAGFDVFKLMVGARGTLGIILEVTLRTMGRRTLPQTIQIGPQTVCRWIQRVLPSDFEAHQRAHLEQLVASDPATATLWASEPLQRLPGDWVICASPEPGFRHRANEPEQWLRQLKAQLDPENKLNPGGMGDLF